MQQSSPHSGDVVAGGYVLRSALGAGGMGVVYEADGNHGSVAVKLPHPDRAADTTIARRFHAEAIAARHAFHKNVVAVIDYSEPDDAEPFVVMEHVRGISLGAIVRRCGALPLLRSANIACQILAGLEATHTAGVVHADIKSDNVLVEPHRDGSETVVIIDFGLATMRRFDNVAPTRDYDAAGRLLMSGTPEYMAPEVIRGRAPTAASDLYAVGVVIYEMITGATPFCGTTAEILDQHLHEPAVLPSARRPDRNIPSRLERVVMTALDKDPARRYASASAFAAAIVAATPRSEPWVTTRSQPEPWSSASETETTTPCELYRAA